MSNGKIELSPPELSFDFKLYLIYASFFSVILVISNMIGLKLIEVPFFDEYAIPIGVLTYPVTFALTDITSEIWGPRRSNLMVYLGFFLSIFSLAFVRLALILPGHSFWVAPANPFGFSTVADYQNAYESVFAINATLIAASMIAYLMAQLIDIRLFYLIKKLSNDRHLWLRNNVSTLISQFVDTSIIGAIVYFYALGMSVDVALPIILTQYSFKAFFALCDTPFVYLGVYLTRKYLHKYQSPILKAI